MYKPALLLVIASPLIAQVDDPEPVVVEVTRGVLDVTLGAEGSAVATNPAWVTSALDSTVLHLVPEGSLVQEGDLLVELDTSVCEEELQVLAVELVEARVSLDVTAAGIGIAESGVAEARLDGELEAAMVELETEEARLDLEEAEAAGNAPRVRLLQRRLELLVLKGESVERRSARRAREADAVLFAARADHEDARRALALMEARSADARDRCARGTLRAPRAGTVGYVQMARGRWNEAGERGRWIEAGESVREGQRLVEIIDLAAQHVELLVEEDRIAELAVGMLTEVVWAFVTSLLITSSNRSLTVSIPIATWWAPP